MTVTIRADADTQALAEKAIAVQDGCNGRGLAGRFAEVVRELFVRCAGTPVYMPGRGSNQTTRKGTFRCP
jgi:hypothetical protein